MMFLLGELSHWSAADFGGSNSVEQASTFGWNQYVGTTGHIIAMKTFGASAPLKELQKKFGFTEDKVVEAARDQLRKARH